MANDLTCGDLRRILADTKEYPDDLRVGISYEDMSDPDTFITEYAGLAERSHLGDVYALVIFAGDDDDDDGNEEDAREFNREYGG